MAWIDLSDSTLSESNSINLDDDNIVHEERSITAAGLYIIRPMIDGLG